MMASRGRGACNATRKRIDIVGPGGRLTSNTAEFQQKCELAKGKLADLPVIELPGIENYRKLKLEELED
jgi:hypothetical protein